MSTKNVSKLVLCEVLTENVCSKCNRKQKNIKYVDGTCNILTIISICTSYISKHFDALKLFLRSKHLDGNLAADADSLVSFTDDGKLSFEEFKAYFADGILTTDELRELFYSIDGRQTKYSQYFNHHRPSHTITDHHRPSHTITDHHIPSQTITYHHRPSHTITDHHRPSHTITDHHRPSHTITDHHIPSQTITDHHIPSHTITDHHRPSHTITDHHIPSHTITDHHIPSQTITDHHIPSQTITDHHRPSQTQANSPKAVLFSRHPQSSLKVMLLYSVQTHHLIYPQKHAFQLQHLIVNIIQLLYYYILLYELYFVNIITVYTLLKYIFYIYMYSYI